MNWLKKIFKSKEVKINIGEEFTSSKNLTHFGTPGDPTFYLSHIKNENDPYSIDDYKGYLGEGFVIHKRILGGLGEVYICNSDDENRFYAFKTFRKEYYYNSMIRNSFLQESFTWARLSGIVGVFPLLGIRLINGRYYLQSLAIKSEETDFPSVNLRDLLNSNQLQIENVLSYSFQIASAMANIHNKYPGISHGDLKPENILNWQSALWITDFGLANLNIELENRFDNKLSTTWAYKAPELWKSGSRNVLTDIYAFGIIAYEIVSGTLPFYGISETDWMNHHLSETLTEYSPKNSVEKAILSLALKCISKNPKHRPQSFLAIKSQIENIWKQWDEKSFEKGKEKYDSLRAASLAAQFSLKKLAIESLVSIGEKELALELFKDYEDRLSLNRFSRDENEEDQGAMALAKLFNSLKTFEPGFLKLKALLLSLNGQEEEAIPLFNEAIKSGFKNPKEEIHCKVEIALAYRRLKNFKEAENIFLELLPTLEEEMLGLVYGNLALVYLDTKDYEKAFPIFRKQEIHNPDSFEIKANYASALLEVGRYDDAEAKYKNAIRLNPNSGLQYLGLAQAQIFQKKYQLAFSTLNAYNQLGESYLDANYAICMLVLFKINGLINDERDFWDWISRDSPKEVLEFVAKKADEMIKRLENRTTDFPEQSEVEGKNSESHATDDNQEDKTDIQKEVEKDPTDSSFRFPFITPRFYLDEGYYSIDYYNDINKESYIDEFREGTNKLLRDPTFLSFNTELTHIPYYFTICPKCKIEILTNRVIGKSLACKRCDLRFPTKDDFNHNPKVFGKISKGIGVPKREFVERTVFFIVQSANKIPIDLLEKACKEAGFTKRTGDTLGYKRFFLTAAFKQLSGVLNPKKKYHVFAKDSKIRINKKGDQTPEEVELLIRKIRLQFDSIISISGDYDPNDEYAYAMYENNLLFEQLLLEKLEKDKNDIKVLEELSHFYNLKDDYQKALPISMKLLEISPSKSNSWSAVGHSLIHLKRFEDAKTYLEEALKIDPSDYSTLAGLMVVYKNTNENEKAKEIEIRLAALINTSFD